VGLAQARAGSILDGARPEAASSDEAGIPVLLAPVTAGIMDSRSQAVRSDETVIPVLLAPATAGIMVSRSQVRLVTTASTAPRVSYGQADLSRGYAIAKLVSTLSAARRAAYGEIASARVKATVLTSIRWSLDNVPLATLAVLTRDGASRDEVITAAEWLYNRLLPHMRPIMQPAFGYPMRQVGALFAAAKYEREARNGISALHDRITLGDFIRGAVCRSERVSVR
jgi:hypothetical protein